jgi:diacylglycerol kinase (ATP)
MMGGVERVGNNPMHRRFAFGIAGIRDGWRREAAFRTHALAAVPLTVLLIWVQPPAIWWATLTLALAAGLGLELLNGAVEALANIVQPAHDPHIRIVKDMASGGALVVNLATLGIAVLLVVAHKMT